MTSITKEIATLRRSLKSVDASLRRLVPMLSAAASNGSETKKAAARRSVRISPKRRAALKLQGRYMGFMRQLKVKQKAQVRKIKEAKGVRAAIRSAKDRANS